MRYVDCGDEDAMDHLAQYYEGYFDEELEDGTKPV